MISKILARGLPFVIVVNCFAQNIPYRDRLFEVQVTENIQYATGAVQSPEPGNKPLLLDLYQPVDDNTLGNRPALILLHGGAFVTGDKTNPITVDLAEDLASRGFVVASISYRLVGDDPPTPGDDKLTRVIAAAVEDASKAVLWMQQNAAENRVDASRIALGGSSAGGITSVLAAYTRNANLPIRAVLNLWGPISDRAREIRAGHPPLLIIQGTEDDLVDFRDAIFMAQRAQMAPIPVEFYLLEGAPHTLPLTTTVGGVSLYDRIADFLSYHLGVGLYSGTSELVPVSAASYQRSVAPGGIVTIFGDAFTDRAVAGEEPELSLDNVTVRVESGAGTHQSALYFVSPAAINAVLPDAATPGVAGIVVKDSTGAERRRTIVLNQIAPSLVAANGDGRGVPAAFLLRVSADDQRSIEPVFDCSDGAGQCVPRPIRFAAGERLFLSLFGTGIRNRPDAVAARVNGEPVAVQYAGPQPEFTGLDQVNIELPPSLAGSGDVSLVVSVDGFASNVLTLQFN
jgi:Esterase/lipase